MMSYVRSLLLALPLLSFVFAVSTVPHISRRGIRWLEPHRSFLVRLEVPDLPLWNPDENIGENTPNALILNFTISSDNRTLLIQGQSFLPLTNAYIPPLFNAPQSAISLTDFEHGTLPDFQASPSFELDYVRLVNPRDDPSIHYYNHHPRITLDLLGAGIAGYNSLLPSQDQPQVVVILQDLNTLGRSTTDPPNHNFLVEDVFLQSRFPRDTFPDVDNLKKCTLWSWRCEDFGDSPWYKYIFRKDFDQYGKVGSFRHMILKRWGNLCENLGLFRTTILVVVVLGMVFSPIILRLCQFGKSLYKTYTAKQAENAWWHAQEEEEELLMTDDEDLDHEPSKEAHGEQIDEEKQLPNKDERPLPPIPVRTVENISLEK